MTGFGTAMWALVILAALPFVWRYLRRLDAAPPYDWSKTDLFSEDVRRTRAVLASAPGRTGGEPT